MQYPRREGPVREDTPWLATMCYPTLFPRGVADPFVGGRRRDVTLANCITHLMKFVDRPEGQAPFYRFASHRTFRYWALDIRLRNQAKSQCRTFLHHNSALAELDPSEVTEEVIGQLMRIATRYLANISGTDGFWLKWQGKLEDAVDQLESLTTFTTYSAADHHHADLYRLMPRFGPEPPAGVGNGNLLPIQERNRLLIANPHIADWWIWERMKVFKTFFLGEDMADAIWHWDRAEWQSRSSIHVHGCSSWRCEGEERLTDLSRAYLRGYIGRERAKRDGEDPEGDGGVSDEEYERVQGAIRSFLNAIGLTARNPSPPEPGAPGCFSRYVNLLNAAQRHSRHGTYCLTNGRCRFGFPKARDEELRIEAHPLTTPPTDNADDWQVIVTPPNAWPAVEGQEGEGPCDRFVNRHLVVQLLAWGANVDFSAIVDNGSAHRYMVKYASKGEAKSAEAQRELTTLIAAASSIEPGDEARQTVPQMMKRVLMMATTRRDMGVQEVVHLDLQVCSVLNNIEFVRAATQNTSVEVQRADAAGGVTSVRDLLVAYSHRMEESAWAVDGGGRPADANELREMNYCTFVATYKLGAGKKIQTHNRNNRVVSFVPVYSNRASSPAYADYCRNQLVKLRPWSGDLWKAWDGQDG
ncbi:unnamed protein product, partial [Scytosiphon promiscuus]